MSAGAGGGHSATCWTVRLLLPVSVSCQVHDVATGTARLRETNTLQQFQDNKYNSCACEKREITAKTSDKDWLWSGRTTDSFAGFSLISVIERMFILSPHWHCHPMEKDIYKEKKSRYNCRINDIKHFLWLPLTITTTLSKMNLNSKQFYL